MTVLRGIFLGIVTAALIAFAVGFIGFAQTVHRTGPASPLPDADGIVALTGGSLERLATGMDLLAQGRGRRLLISGVNAKVTDAELEAAIGADPDLFRCCVDVGRAAENTLGNAAETAAWAKRNGFDELIIVTADYHMPRSLAELRAALPQAVLIAYPVSTAVTAPGSWQRDIGAALRLAGEYVKYLVIRGRETLLSLDEPAPAEPPSS
jgi:uncharacterized SAM-binding protein YcdF (DUF218 family)